MNEALRSLPNVSTNDDFKFSHYEVIAEKKWYIFEYLTLKIDVNEMTILRKI